MCSVLAVHPHMRGEHPPCVHMASPSHGSSPHAWGTPLTHFLGITNIRFIPTCVGNTRPHSGSPWHQPVHPHMRGEHNANSTLPLGAAGSSPHAWGTLPRGGPDGNYSRFIPTCVGNTWQPGHVGGDWPV